MPRHNIRKNDDFRIVLTDVLPYELPFQFTNHYFHKFLQHASNRSQVSTWLEEWKYFTIPLEYKIPKGALSGRVMSIMHPLSQVQFVKFYSKYDSLIVHFCSRSPFSIRYPAKVADTFYMKNLETKQVEDDENKGTIIKSSEVTDFSVESEDSVARTYFAYKDFSLLYQFFTHPSFQRLEKKFSFFKRVDISKCFYSIYTHSICWAVTSKEIAKSQISSENFENIFDRLMRHSNYSETNGIIVGPEVSRIFSEIILQSIDIAVQKRLLDHKPPARNMVDYEIKRYMDDYFVFSKTIILADLIKKVISEECQSYKLYLNESKELVQERPFMTDISVSKVDLKRCLDSYFSKEPLSESMTSGNLKTNKILNEIKAIVQRNKIKFSQVDNFIFSQLHSAHHSIIGVINNKESTLEFEKIERFLDRFISLISFLLCMNLSFRGVHKTAEILLNIKDCLVKSECLGDERRKSDILDYFSKCLFDELNIVIDGASTEYNIVERTSLLMMQKNVCGSNMLSESRFVAVLDLDNLSSDLYMKFTTALIYIHSEDGRVMEGFETCFEDIVSYAEKEIFSNCNHFENSEFTFLFFDYFNCPYISINRKWEHYKAVVERFDLEKKGVNQFFSQFLQVSELVDFEKIVKSDLDWLCFTNWGIQKDMRSEVLKKELAMPY